MQDNYASPSEPTEAMTFSTYGLSGFEVQYWNGSAWTTVPGGSMTGNNKVWKKITFDSVTTTKIRVQTNASVDGYSRLVEVEAWGDASTRTNVALVSNGGTVTVSSILSSSFPGESLNNSDRKGLNWGNGGGWRDAEPGNTFPDSAQVDFSGSRTIDEVDVFTVQDNYASPSEPTEVMTFSTYGLSGFEVQYWNGSAWTTVPGGSVSGNNKVWKKITFAPITTTKIRVLTNASPDGYSRLTEVEAWTVASGGSAAQIHWLVADQLGTPRMIFDETGSLANTKRHDYLPFGEELFATQGLRTTQIGYFTPINFTGDTTRQKFTSKERDNETGLDYFLARYYSSTQGRFTSADQPFADQYEDDPQSWNLYSYVGNNPLSFTDPFGLWKWVDPDNNGKRFIQWEEGDDWYTLSEFLYKETGRDYLPRDLEKVYSSGGLGADTIVDFSGAPSRYFTNNRGGVQDTSWDFYLTVLPAARALKGAGGLISGAARLFTKEAVTETTSLGLSTAARAATGFTTKAAARAAVDGLAASPAAKAAARKAISRATVNSTIEVVEEAGTVYVRIKRAGFDGYQVVESVIKSDGTKEVVQKAYDAAGRLVHYDPK